VERRRLIAQVQLGQDLSRFDERNRIAHQRDSHPTTMINAIELVPKLTVRNRWEPSSARFVPQRAPN
jgi:hypothetical protein